MKRLVPRHPAPWLAAFVCVGLFSALLAGCAGPSPAVQLYRLNALPPVTPPSASTASVNWQLMQPVIVPAYLDRDAVLLPQGQSGLLALSGHRWAESLRDSVPRVLRQDLSTLLGESRVWAAPVPAGVVVARQLRVELLSLEAAADRSSVLLRARWSLVDPAGTVPARADAVALTAPSAGTDVDSLVAAHRLALWRLAERIEAASR